MLISCPCCGYQTLSAAQNYETCPVCCWVDVPSTDRIARRPMNTVTLLQAQRNFLTFGACAPEVLTLVRPPTSEEQRAVDWQPLELRLRQQQHALLDRFSGQKPKLFDLLTAQIDEARIHFMVDPDGDPPESRLWQQYHALDYELMNKVIVGEFPAQPDIYRLLESISWWVGFPLPRNPDEYRQTCIESAFACTALLLAANQPQTSPMIALQPTQLINLVKSVLYLGQTFIEPALQFLSETVLTLDLDRHLPEFSLSILVLAAALSTTAEKDLAALRAWVLQEEHRLGNGADWSVIAASTATWSSQVADIVAILV